MNHQRKSRFNSLRQTLRQRQTYRRVVYVLLAVPTGLVYWIVLSAAVAVDLLLSALRLLQRGTRCWRFELARAAWQRLAGWERHHTMQWLGVEPAPFQQPPSASLAFLLLKLPVGYPVAFSAVTALVFAGLLVVLAAQRVVGSPAGSSLLQTLLIVAGGPLLSIAIAAVVPLVLNFLALLWGRLAVLAYGGDATLQQLREAEARAAAEEAKANQADRSRRDLIMNVSHDLRTPTASIRGHIESLLLTLEEGDANRPSDATLRTNLDIVYREAERLGLLIDELLALARNETDKLVLDIRPLAAGEVVEEAYRSLAPLARRERHITLVREVEAELPLLLADRQRLMQVLLNLVRNAITYTPAGGIVNIVLRRDGDRVLLAVQDTGAGIPRHELERIFERFHRIDESRARTAGGFGLGLTIVRELVVAMGGSVTASSIEGEGSSFEVRLPVAAAALPSGRSSSAAEGA